MTLQLSFAWQHTHEYYLNKSEMPISYAASFFIMEWVAYNSFHTSQSGHALYGCRPIISLLSDLWGVFHMVTGLISETEGRGWMKWLWLSCCPCIMPSSWSHVNRRLCSANLAGWRIRNSSMVSIFSLCMVLSFSPPSTIVLSLASYVQNPNYWIRAKSLWPVPDTFEFIMMEGKEITKV